MKSSIVRKYSKTTTLQDVGSRLKNEFKELEIESGEKAIDSIIRHIDKIIEKIIAEIEAEECAERELDDDGDETETDSSIPYVSLGSTLDLCVYS